MKLYHGTTIENATSIVANGFKLSPNDDSRCWNNTYHIKKVRYVPKDKVYKLSR